MLFNSKYTQTLIYSSEFCWLIDCETVLLSLPGEQASTALQDADDLFCSFGTAPLSLCISPTGSCLPVAAPLPTSRPWSSSGTISRSAWGSWMALSLQAAACSQCHCPSSWGSSSTPSTSTTPCGSSASLCLFCSWLGLHTNRLFPAPKTRREERRENSNYLLRKRFAISLFSKFPVTESGLLGSQLHFSDTLCLMFTW